MNTTLQNLLARSGALHTAGRVGHAIQASAKPARTGCTGAPADFASVLNSSTEAAATTATTPAPADNVARLGPFTAGALAKPAQQAIPDPAPLPTASFTPLPASQAALLNQPWDPFNQAQHEAKMNNWYIQTTQA